MKKRHVKRKKITVDLFWKILARRAPRLRLVRLLYIWGLGSNVPFETGNQSDSLHALVDGHFVELGVPYLMGFFAKGLEGRIDDPNAGWKGRGLWVTSGNRTPQHIEGIDAPAPGAPGATPQTLSSPLVVQFQLRPDPLTH